MNIVPPMALKGAEKLGSIAFPLLWQHNHQHTPTRQKAVRDGRG